MLLNSLSPLKDPIIELVVIMLKTVQSFPVPVHVGAFHIHYPEHYNVVHHMSLPCTRVGSAILPNVIDPVTSCVHFTAHVLGRDRLVEMSSRNPLMCTTRIYENETVPIAFIHQTVVPADNHASHDLVTEIEVRPQDNELVANILPLLSRMSTTEDTKFLRSIAHLTIDELLQLGEDSFKQYRYSVFSKKTLA